MFDRHALEEALAQIQNVPRLRVTVPHALAIPALLRGSDILSIVPASLARALMGTGELLVRQLPYKTAAATTRAVWHRRHDHDAAHAWLRDVVISVAKAAADE